MTKLTTWKACKAHFDAKLGGDKKWKAAWLAEKRRRAVGTLAVMLKSFSLAVAECEKEGLPRNFLKNRRVQLAAYTQSVEDVRGTPMAYRAKGMSEADVQRSIVRYVRDRCGYDAVMAISNERMGSLPHDMGLTVGASDLFVTVKTPRFAGFFLELKAIGPSSGVTRDQLAFIEQKRARGYWADIGWGLDDSLAKVKEYLSDSESPGATEDSGAV